MKETRIIKFNWNLIVDIEVTSKSIYYMKVWDKDNEYPDERRESRRRS